MQASAAGRPQGTTPRRRLPVQPTQRYSAPLSQISAASDSRSRAALQQLRINALNEYSLRAQQLDPTAAGACRTSAAHDAAKPQAAVRTDARYLVAPPAPAVDARGKVFAVGSPRKLPPSSLTSSASFKETARKKGSPPAPNQAPPVVRESEKNPSTRAPALVAAGGSVQHAVGPVVPVRRSSSLVRPPRLRLDSPNKFETPKKCSVFCDPAIDGLSPIVPAEPPQTNAAALLSPAEQASPVRMRNITWDSVLSGPSRDSSRRVRSARDDPTRRHATMAVLLEELESEAFSLETIPIPTAQADATVHGTCQAPTNAAGGPDGMHDGKPLSIAEVLAQATELSPVSKSGTAPAQAQSPDGKAVARSGPTVVDFMCPPSSMHAPLAATPAQPRLHAGQSHHTPIPLAQLISSANNGHSPAVPRLCGSMLGELSDDSDSDGNGDAQGAHARSQRSPAAQQESDGDDEEADVMISPFKFAARAQATTQSFPSTPAVPLTLMDRNAVVPGPDTPTSLALLQGHLAQRRRPHNRARIISSSSEHAVSLHTQQRDSVATDHGSEATSNTASNDEGPLGPVISVSVSTPHESAKSGSSAAQQQLQRKQAEAIQELIDTEEAFLKDLCVIKTIFADNMSPHGGPMQYLVSPQDHMALFCNVDDLVSSSSFFLIQLKEAWQQVGQPVDEDTDPNYIGEVFLRNLNCFKLLELFCCNQTKSLNTLQRLCDTQILFAKWLDACQQRQPECRKMPLSAFLLSPVQRVTKYPLLLERIIMYTADDDPQKPSLLEAKALVSQYLQHINEATRIAESDDRMAGLVRQLKEQGDVRIDRWLATAPSHQLVAEGNLRLSQHKRRGFEDVYVYVFSDMLLVTKLGTKASGRLAIDPLPMRSMLVVEDPLSEPTASVKDQCVFLVEDISNNIQYYFRASAPTRKSYWVQLLRAQAMRAGKWRLRRGGLADLFLSVAEREEGHFLSSPPESRMRNGRRNPIMTPWHPSAARIEGMPRDSRPTSTFSLPLPGPAHPSSMYSCNFYLPSPTDSTSPSLPRTRPASGLPLPPSLSLASVALSPAPFRISRISEA